jgi:hypothetical protein
MPAVDDTSFAAAKSRVAYDILRHRGVPLGKRVFLSPVNWL